MEQNNLSQISQALELLNDSLKKAKAKILKLEEPQKRLSFEDIRQKKALYDELGKATDRLNANQRTLSHLILTREQLRQMRRQIRSDATIPVSIKQSLVARVEDLDASITDLIEASKALEKGLEQMTRYYNNFSYLASSHYLE